MALQFETLYSFGMCVFRAGLAQVSCVAFVLIRLRANCAGSDGKKNKLTVSSSQKKNTDRLKIPAELASPSHKRDNFHSSNALFFFHLLTQLARAKMWHFSPCHQTHPNPAHFYPCHPCTSQHPTIVPKSLHISDKSRNTIIAREQCCGHRGVQQQTKKKKKAHGDDREIHSHTHVQTRSIAKDIRPSKEILVPRRISNHKQSDFDRGGTDSFLSRFGTPSESGRAVLKPVAPSQNRNQ